MTSPRKPEGAPRPLWRWWLFRLAVRFEWFDLLEWSVLPEWVSDGQPFPEEKTDAPF